MLHRKLALVALGLLVAACSGAPGENAGSSNAALNGNGQGNDGQQGDDCQDDQQNDHCVEHAHVQLISMDNTDLITGTNLVTLQTQQYQLVFGSTQLFSANLAQYPQGPIKGAAQNYDTALSSGNQSAITTTIQNYASVQGRAQITFTTNLIGQRTLTSFKPVAN